MASYYRSIDSHCRCRAITDDVRISVAESVHQPLHRLDDWPKHAVSTIKILVIDNYDSFVYTLVGYLQELGAETTVYRNDDLSFEEVSRLAADFDGVLVSPGPGDPAGAGVSIELIKWCGEQSKPMLGVCLGHQALAEAYGGTVTHTEELMHGKTSLVQHENHPIFARVANPFTATRYHSLAAVRETIPEELEIIAATEGGVIMGLAHRSAPLWGLQYHPESVLTQQGYQMLGNWLEFLGLDGAAEKAAALSPLLSSE